MTHALRLAALLSVMVLPACGDDSDATGGAGSGTGGATGGGGSGSGTGGGSVASVCKPVTGEGTTHLSIEGSETWTAAGSPHVVGADLIVPEGATLTVEPCAEVRLEPNRIVEVRGALVAEGAADRPILFTAADAVVAWGYLSVTDPGRITLAHTTIDRGGNPSAGSFGAIDARGIQGDLAAQVLSVDHVTVTDSGVHGVSLRDNAGFTSASTALTIQGAALAPLRILPRLATNVPDGDYTGNAEDLILVEPEVGGNISLEDVTFHDRGVPYQIGGTSLPELVVGPSPVTLTLEPGVVLGFEPGGRLTADADGAAGGIISAVGTAEQPVVFTSSRAIQSGATPSAGDWLGIWIEHVDAATRLDRVEIRYAGAPSGANSFHCEPDGTFSDEDALITFFEQPPSSILTHSVLSDSAKRGVNLGYYGDPVDFLSTNTFENIAQCKVTTPRPVEGACPETPCP